MTHAYNRNALYKTVLHATLHEGHCAAAYISVARAAYQTIPAEESSVLMVRGVITSYLYRGLST